MNVRPDSKTFIMAKFLKSPELEVWDRTDLPKITIPDLGTRQWTAIRAKQEAILEQLHKLQLEFAQLEVMSSPIGTIPNEILSLIFEELMPCENPWASLVMRVCRR